MDEEKRAEWEGWIKRAISDYNSAKKLIDGDEKYLIYKNLLLEFIRTCFWISQVIDKRFVQTYAF